MTRALVVAIVGLAALLLAAGLQTWSESNGRPTGAEAAGQAPPATAQPVEEPEPADGQRHLFRPEDLPLLEGPDRALWQQPDQVMDALGIADGSRVADIGAGAGWFTIRLAQRVCPQPRVCPKGKVYAQDVQREMVIAIRRRVERENLSHVVEVIQGTERSPELPPDLDAILAVDVYPEVRDRVAFLESLAASLQPYGRIGIVNYKPAGGGPGPAPDERVDSATVIEEAERAGLRVIRTLELTYQYMVVLGRPAPDSTPRAATAPA